MQIDKTMGVRIAGSDLIREEQDDLITRDSRRKNFCPYVEN